MKSFTTFSCALSLAFAAIAGAQMDPGTRNGPALSGQPLRGLAPAEIQAFLQGRDAFNEIDDVRDGLGPRFNLDSCGGCHARPASGGSSPAVNPQLRVALKFGADNRIPNFIQQDGPVRVVRFRRTANGQPDGGVHNLFVVSGRSDAPANCKIQQPDFTQANNLSFRIPTPVFGLGLVEAISDSALRTNLAANAQAKRQAGVQGRFNVNGNDGTITRFGWKAQNKSLLLFSGEAYNVEVGVTNPLFPQEREEDPACATNPGIESAEDILEQSAFMRYLAPPVPPQASPATDRGRALFEQVGCALCHTATLITGQNVSPALSRQPVNLYSDLALHRMGANLDDGVTQGQAQGADWRTAPLWGLGDRIFLLHDGRTKDLADAIRQHDGPGSEGHQAVVNYNSLSGPQKQDLLNFLRSL